MRQKEKPCVMCGRVTKIFSKGRCKFCSITSYKKPTFHSKPKPNKVELDNFFEEKISELMLLRKSEESGEKISYPTRANIAHLFPKRNHQSVCNHSENYIFLTVDEHNTLDNKCLDVHDFNKLQTLFPNMFLTLIKRMSIVRNSVVEKTKFVDSFDKFLENFNKL